MNKKVVSLEIYQRMEIYLISKQLKIKYEGTS